MIASWRVLRFYDDFSPCTAQIFNYSFVSFLLLFVCHLSSSRPIRLRWSIDKFHPTRPVEAASSVFVRKDEEDRRARGNCAFISSPSRRSLRCRLLLLPILVIIIKREISSERWRDISDFTN